jgi:hydrogenase maturation protein HypF
MLPYTAIHHLLLAAVGRPLVTTSGNRSGEPIAHDDADAVTRLADLCDAFLTHDRPIHVPVDDSVVRIVDGHLLPIRRARGYAPVPVALRGARRPVLATGGELKSTCCVASTDRAWVSQHVGDMENLETMRAFEATAARFEQFYEVDPAVVAIDAHPGYLAGGWGRRRAGNRPVLEVQHHHAHLAALMAEHGLDPHRPVLGVAFDGTGYGDDGTIWGGEVLRADVDGYERVAHLAPIPLPGGDAAIRHPSRVALAHLHTAGIDWADDLPPVAAVRPGDRANLAVQLERGVGCVPTTSMGRLFDAVASLLGLRHRISYEAQAAIDLENAAERSAAVTPNGAGAYRFVSDGQRVEHADVWRAIVADLRSGRPVGEIADAFHHAVVDLVVDVAARHATAGEPVLLSGGVFQNALLVERAVAALDAAGFVPVTHRLVPPNDGGLALGQAFVAAHTTRLDPFAGREER